MKRQDLATALGIELIDVDGCWLPGRRPNGGGYVELRRGGVRAQAHRLALLVAGRISPDELRPGRRHRALVTDHLCRQRACCRPSHLELVDQRTNVLRGLMSTRDACRRGHPYVPGSFGWRTGHRGYPVKRCYVCKRSHDDTYRKRNRA